MEKLIEIPCSPITIEGMLRIPPKAKGLVLFAHGSGSSRFSPRNNFVAAVLVKSALATLLVDLLSAQEDQTYETRFDIPLLTQRLAAVATWLKQQKETKDLPLGVFGASTGAAAALHLAAAMPQIIASVVSRGGRPDLAMPILDRVTAPTLLIVGGNDFAVIEMNQKAYDHLSCTKELTIIPGATHLFEEPGCLEEVARVAKEWFLQTL
jgi:putative phosphoribosyl transferase